MGFIDENGYSLINEEQKVRISLSEKAKLIIAEDMDTFGIQKAATFINTVFANYKAEAASSISLYLQQREIELDRLLSETDLSTSNKQIAIKQLLDSEKKAITAKFVPKNTSNVESKLYHINDNNVKYLVEDCNENQYYHRPGQYIRSIIEEYCSLPFIMRERIYRKEVYDTIEQACKESKILKVKAYQRGKERLFYVYPYKIVPDSFHSQSYLVCYSRNAEKEDRNKIVASFSMARIQPPTILQKNFHLSKQEIDDIELQISKYSPAYLIGTPELITVKLTEHGKRTYRSKLFSRPEKIESLSTDNIYVFDCTQHQIFNYFFSFGADAEIISPEHLRGRFNIAYERAYQLYNAPTTQTNEQVT